MTFEWPLALLALLALPAVLALYVVRERRRRSYAARFSNPALLPNLVARSPGWRRHLPIAVLAAALAAMIVGVARPHATVTVRREQATVILALDVSRSMAARDVRPTRLQAARAAAAAFIARIPKKYRVAVISFSSRAVVALPPTPDRLLAREALASLKPGEGTAIGDAVTLAARLASRQRTSDGVVPPAALLLISDGKQDGGRATPGAAAARARALKMPVYTVLVGTDSGVVEAPLPGGLHEVVRVPPDPETLQQLAQATGGAFFTATNDARLQQIYRRLGSRLGNKRTPRELTDLFAGGSAMLLLAGAGLSTFWFRRPA